MLSKCELFVFIGGLPSFLTSRNPIVFPWTVSCSGSRVGCHSRNLLQQSANSGIHCCVQRSGGAVTWLLEANAGIAQLVEQLICNQQVVGSNPTAGFPLKIPICRGCQKIIA